MPHFSHRVACCALLLECAACAPGDRAGEASAVDVDTSGLGAPAASRTDDTVLQDTFLTFPAERIVAFLRGTAGFETLSVADTVQLLIPAEGGGASRAVARAGLRERHAWTVQTSSQQYSFVPPADLTEIRIVPGRHVNCFEGALAERVPEMAGLPHVGVRLEPRNAQSCLQGWNSTFVFDTSSGHPRLTAAIYDQWEW